jgi:hypothetical protein
MNELEDQLRDALLSAREHSTGGLSGPALRRTARRRTYRARTGGVAVVGAVGAAAALVGPGLLTTNGSGAGSVGAASGKSSSAAPATGSNTSVPVQAALWNPAGSLIHNADLLAAAPTTSSTDAQWKRWGRVVLDPSTVSVEFAETLPITGSTAGQPVVVESGRTAADQPLQLAVLTTTASDTHFTGLHVLGVTPSQALGQQAVAVATSNGGLFVAADGGVTSATYTYTDANGSHVVTMKVQDGVATSWLSNLKPAGDANKPLESAAAKPSTSGDAKGTYADKRASVEAGTSETKTPSTSAGATDSERLVNVKAMRGDTVLWDGLPIKGL